MWAYLVIYVLSGIYYATFINRGSSSGIVLPVVILFFLWRGSRFAWWATVLLDVFGVYVSIGAAYSVDSLRDVSGTDVEPHLHLIEAAFLSVHIALLVHPATRRFCKIGANDESPRATTAKARD